MALIEVHDLTKTYKVNERKEGLKGSLINLVKPKYINKTVVDSINFKVDEGEIVGYIGANGAGKSTSIKMLTGILTPTSGCVKVNGIIPYNERIKNNKQIGVVFGQRSQLWWDLPVIESYNLISKMYEIPKDLYKENLEYFTELLDLKDLLKTPVRQLSLGQKMRCEIVAAFLHDPKIVFLDEPTIGLDFMIKDSIRAFIRDINKKKKTTVIITTHDLQDIEETCNRIIIIDKGKIMYDDTRTKINEHFGKFKEIILKIKDKNIELKTLLNELQDITVINEDNYEVKLKINKDLRSTSDVLNIISPYCTILDVNINDLSIEEILKDIYKDFKK